MKTDELFDRFEKAFFSRLDAKTGWGKEQVKSVFITTLLKVVIEAQEEAAIQAKTQSKTQED